MKIFINRKSASIITMFVVLMAVMSSCKKDNDEVVIQGDAKVRVVNSVQGSSPQDFYQGDTKISTSAVAYGEASPYYTVKAGSSTLAFKNTTTVSTTASTNVSIGQNAMVTVFYYADGTGATKVDGVADDNTAPASGKARVRFINLGASFNNGINVVTAASSALVNGLNYQSSSSYYSIDANTALAVNIIGSATITTIPGATFQSGKNYTVWFDAANTTTANYHVIVQN